MNAIQLVTRQRGFFDLGLGLALFAIFGAVSWGVVSYENGKSVESRQTQSSIDETHLSR